MEKPLDTTTIAQAKAAQPDLKVFGDGDAWKLICKASSASGGWMKSTKAMEVSSGMGCLVQVTSEFRSKDGEVTACAEAVTYVPRVSLVCRRAEDGSVVERRLLNSQEDIAPDGWEFENPTDDLDEEDDESSDEE